jgi:hypothetical protein
MRSLFYSFRDFNERSHRDLTLSIKFFKIHDLTLDVTLDAKYPFKR